MTGIRVWISRTNSFGSPVMIVQVCRHSSLAGSFHPSHKPAKTNGELSFMPIEYGNFSAENAGADSIGLYVESPDFDSAYNVAEERIAQSYKGPVHRPGSSIDRCRQAGAICSF
jgi:hypothetical protein